MVPSKLNSSLCSTNFFFLKYALYYFVWVASIQQCLALWFQHIVRLVVAASADNVSVLLVIALEFWQSKSDIGK